MLSPTVNPFTSEFGSPTPPLVPHQRPFSSQPREVTPSVSPFARSAILRDALAGGNYPASTPDPSAQSTSTRSGQNSAVFQPLRRQPSQVADVDTHVRTSTSQVADAGSPFSDPRRYNLSAEQAEVIDRLRLDNVPVETIARVIEGFVTSNLSGGETSNNRKLGRERSFVSAAPPPSYQTRDG